MMTGWFAPFLLLLTLLLTGCPHNQYIVELTPRGQVMERRLSFYREDGTDTNGAPKYESFPVDELALISKLYPPGCITQQGERRTVVGQFAGPMPADVGGAGSYTSLTNNLGGTAFYMERFRGNDDFTSRAEKHSKAADQLTDLVIGWSRAEFGREKHFQDLRRFLDTNFRRDLKNLGFYAAMVQTSPALNQEAPEEFAVRFGQYLVERGYLKPEDCPELAHIAEDGDTKRLMRVVQWLVAMKLGISASKTLPPAVAMLADPDKAWKSWERYLTTTDLYRVRLRKWQKEKMMWGMGVVKEEVAAFLKSGGRTNSAASRTPAPNKPDPSEVAADLTLELLDSALMDSSADDHVAVHLSLPSRPAHTNGKWDETRKEVFWESNLEDRTNAVRLPLFCYVSWSQPNEPRQKNHFGNVVLRGDELTRYCLWYAGLDQKQVAEWDGLLAGLKRTEGWESKLQTFRFSDDPTVQGTNRPPSRADLPRELIKSGLEERQAAGDK
jgi:hypothetical protein